MAASTIQEIQSLGELQELVAAAKEDNHDVVFPSHIVRKNGELIGYAGIFSMPILMWWLDSKKGKARDSLEMLKEIENIARAKQVKRYVTICAESSPYFKHMNRLGYSKLGETVMFQKEII
jgi:hypothetical protein